PADPRSARSYPGRCRLRRRLRPGSRSGRPASTWADSRRRRRWRPERHRGPARRARAGGRGRGSAWFLRGGRERKLEGSLSSTPPWGCQSRQEASLPAVLRWAGPVSSHVYLVLVLILYAVGALHVLVQTLTRRHLLVTSWTVAATLVGFALHTA